MDVFIRDDYQYDWNEPNSWDDWGIFDSWFQGYRFPTVVATQTATANPNPSMVFIRDDYQYDWNEPESWDDWGIFDSWFQGYRFPTAVATLTATGNLVEPVTALLTAAFTQSATGIKVQLASASISAAFTQSATALRLISTANAVLATSVSQTATALRYAGGSAALAVAATQTVTARVEHNASAALATAFTQTVTARLLKLAQLDIPNFATLNATAEVTHNAGSALSAAFTQSARGGRLVQVNETFNYTWDTLDPDTWQGFVRDEWGPTGFFAFDNIQLSARSGLVLRSSANLNSEFAVATRGSELHRGTATLPSAFAVDTDASLTPAILPFELSVSTNLNVSGRMVVAGRADLSAFAADLSVGRRFLGGRAGLNSEFAVVAQPSVLLGGRAELSAFAAQLTAGRISTVRGTASLSAEFAAVFAGELQLLESSFIFKILPETRNYLVQTESRDFKVLPENTEWSVTSEDRNIKVLPESRDLNIADLMMG